MNRRQFALSSLGSLALASFGRLVNADIITSDRPEIDGWENIEIDSLKYTKFRKKELSKTGSRIDQYIFELEDGHEFSNGENTKILIDHWLDGDKLDLYDFLNKNGKEFSYKYKYIIWDKNLWLLLSCQVPIVRKDKWMING